MGAFCKIHQSYQPIVKSLTVDQLPAKKSSDVIGYILGCGHKYGNDEFMKIQEQVNKIRIQFSNERQALADAEKSALSKAFESMNVKGGQK